ncbi:MAG: tetratricopeptide repeat protein [Chloroflexi bacterium]|nr:tetratricopeptide repeat protein [Chloroflexota bacterium]
MDIKSVPFLSKVLPPRGSGETVRRQRLLDLLHRNFHRKLLVVTAPAGYGKTTLAASFAEDSEVPTCWLSLDEWDQDAARFLEYLVASLQRQFLGVGDKTLDALYRSGAAPMELPQLVGMLASEIYTGIPECFLLVLDDVHTVEGSRPVATALDMFLHRLPENCRVLMLSRSPVGLASLPRMVANQEAVRLTASDLAFTRDEVAEFLTLHGLRVSQAEAETLSNQCEGWIAGIALAALSGGSTTFPTSGAGVAADSAWCDYMMAEVYGKLPKATRAFLRRSSIFDELRPSHCRAILSVKNPERRLTSLCESLQLVTRLESQGEALYRYHSLFRSFLLRTLRQDEEEFRDLHRKAGSYFVAQERWDAGISHLRQADALEEAAQVIEKAAPPVYQAGQWSKLAGWIDTLPPALLDSHPLLMIYRARTAVQLGDESTAARLAGQSLDLLREGPSILLAQAHVARAMTYRLANALDRCVDECDLAIGLMGEPRDQEAALTLAESYLCKGAACVPAGDYEEAEAALGRALVLYQDAGDVYHTAYAHHHLGAVGRATGDFGGASAHYAQARVAWLRVGNHGLLASTLNNLGNLYMSQGHLLLAEETLTEAGRYAQEAGATRVRSFVLNSLGEVLNLMGRYSSALACLQESLTAAREASEHRIIVSSTERLGLTYLALGQLDRARVLIEEARGLIGPQESNGLTGRLLASQGLVARRSGQKELARELLEQAADILSQHGSWEFQAQCHFYLGELLWSSREPAAREAIKAVAELLREPGSERTLLPAARPFKRFVQYAARLPEGRPVFQRLLAALAEFPGEEAVHAADHDPDESGVLVRAYALGKTRVEVLTPRPREVRWPSEKAKELLFYLLMREGWASKEEIIAALWPDVMPAKGDTVFWTTAYRLRRAVHEDCLAREGSFYRLNPDAEFWVDAREFERLVYDGSANSEDDECRIQAMQQAVDLYRGPYLTEVYSEWAEPMRSRLQDRYVSTLLLLARIWLARGTPSRAVELCERALQADSYQDDAYFIELEALVQDGRIPEADRVYRRYLQVMRDEVGAAPNQKILDLHQRMIRGEYPSPISVA